MMKEEYDFSKGERGKFYQPNAKFNSPIYLDQEAYSFVEKIAENRNQDMSKVASDLIKTDKKIADLVR